MYEQCGRSSRDRVHVIDFFPLIQRIVRTSDAIGFVTKGITVTEYFRASFETFDGHDFTAPELCRAVRAR